MQLDRIESKYHIWKFINNRFGKNIIHLGAKNEDFRTKRIELKNGVICVEF